MMETRRSSRESRPWAGGRYSFASEERRADKEVVIEAAKTNNAGLALYFASEELRADKEIVLMAVKENGNALEYASAVLRGDKEVVREALDQSSQALEYVSEDIKADKDVVLGAVKQYGWNVRFASKELKADKEVVLVAVKQYGRVIEYASEELKADKEVVTEAVKTGYALEYAPKEHRADKGVVLEAVKTKGKMLRFASEELKADREVVIEAVAQCAGAIQHASPTLRSGKGKGGLKFYLKGLHQAYTLTTDEFLSTFAFGCKLPDPTTRPGAGGEENPKTTQPSIAGSAGTAPFLLWKLGKLGVDAGVAFNKNVASYAGVRCAEFVGVPWSSVTTAARNLGM